MTKTDLDRIHNAHLVDRRASVSDIEVDATEMELDLNQLESDLVALHGDCLMVEVGMSDLQETDYPSYCAVYECLNGCQPLLRREAE